jgi:MFS family permease
MPQPRLVACVLLPFAAGYYLSYLFRSINALIASDLVAELEINAADLGLLTSVYFLVFAAVQLPFGVLLDRYGPKTIQSALLLLASSGALIFALADGLIGLIVGRAVLSLGVALALMAGFKAIVLWFPPERILLVNGWYVTLGALGAVTATAPAEFIVQTLGWRGLFALLAGMSALAALLLLLAAPECQQSSPVRRAAPAAGLWAIYRDFRFWRMAPLSAIGIGTSWSLQGLWAAPWLRDVTGLDRVGVVDHLSIMAFAVCTSALLLGVVAKWLRRRGIKTEWVLAGALGVSMGAQAALLFECPLPSYLLWSLIAAAGAVTVLSFAILTEYFPKEMSGRANAALNILHVGIAFLLQTGTGLIIAQWPQSNGAYPVEAHQTAMGALIGLEVGALVWFVLSAPLKWVGEVGGLTMRIALHQSTGSGQTIALTRWYSQGLSFDRQVAGWRLAALAASVLLISLATFLVISTAESGISVHVVKTWQLLEAGQRPHKKPGTPRHWSRGLGTPLDGRPAQWRPVDSSTARESGRTVQRSEAVNADPQTSEVHSPASVPRLDRMPITFATPNPAPWVSR